MFFTKKNKLIKSLTKLFCENANRFNGVYNGVYKILCGENKKNTKVLDEFYERVSFVAGYEELSKVLKKNYPTSQLTPKKLKEFNSIFSKAIENAGISHTYKDEVIVLTVNNVLHYQEWDDQELYVDTKVKIIFPAWYQNDNLIEKGYCTMINHL
ncbi:MAG: hypothetical protein J5766_05295 [Clostridia bacterium]|nr:hypothetical protein [Clostridia bacterium]